MAIKLASGRDAYSAPLIEAEFPLTLDPEIYKGAWVITSSGNTFYSDGSNWISTTSAGIEVFQPPWEGVPDGWFSVIATPPGDLSDRNVIASKFDVSYVTPDAQTWPIVDPSNLFTDAAGTTPVISAPEPIGLLEDTTVPQINWFQDVSIDRPQWDQITRNGETVNVLKFDNLGQELKVNFPEAVSGTMVHVTTAGVYRTEVDIPAGEYNFGRWHGWADIEEIILLDRTLTESEYTQLKNELAKTRNRIVEQDLPSDMTNAFRERTELASAPDIDYTGVTDVRSLFRSGGGTWLNAESNYSFPESAADVTNFRETFRNNAITSIPENLFANLPNLTSALTRTFGLNNLTSIPENLFANNPNITSLRSTFGTNNITSIPENLFANLPNLTSLTSPFSISNDGVFSFNDLTSIPENLFANNPNVTSFRRTFRNNNITSVPENLFANCPNTTLIEDLFSSNNISSIPENLFANLPNLRNVMAIFSRNNISSIPENLFANNPMLEVVGLGDAGGREGAFASNNITSIPENLFANNPNITNFAQAFRSNDLTSVPAGLFDNTPNVVQGSPTDLGGFTHKGFFRVFFSNVNLTDVPVGLFDNQTRTQDYREAFTNCALTQQSVDNVLVSVLTSVETNNIVDGWLSINDGTNATPSQTGKDAADILRNTYNWVVELNGY